MSSKNEEADTKTISLLQEIYREDGRFTLKHSHKMISEDA